MEAFSVGMQDKFKDNAPLKAQAAALQSQLDQIKNDKVTLEISTLVTSDVLTPNEASTLVSTLTKTGGDIQKRLNTLIDVQGTEGVQRLSTILTMLPNENNQKQLVFAMKHMNKAEADATMSAIEELGKIPDYVGIELNIETQKADVDRLKRVGSEIAALNKAFPNGQVSKKSIELAIKEAGGAGKNLTLDSALRDWDAISKLPKDLQFQAIITMGSIEFSDSFDAILDRELKTAFQKQAKGAKTGRLAAVALESFVKNPKNIEAATKAAMEKIRTQLFGAAVPSTTKPGGPVTPKDEGPKRDESFLSDLAQRLKLVKEGGFNALTPLISLRKFLNDGGKNSINPGLDAQAGAIKQIETAAKTAGISIDKDFMEIIRGLDAEQFMLWSKTLFEIGKNGRITALKDDFVTINEGFRKATIAGYVQDVKDASKEIENQVAAHKLLTQEGYNSLEIQKILQDATLTAKIAAQGGLKATKEEQIELNKEIKKTIDLNYQLSTIKLNENIAETKMQIEAFNKLTAAGVKQEVILEILKDKSNVWAIGTADATVNIKDKFGDLIGKTKQYYDMLELIRKQSLTFEQTTQEALDANTASLDLQARTLQNQFDLANIGLKAKIKTAEIDVKSVNDSIQKEQDKIDAINLTLKYDSNIGQNFLDDLQEKINDAQRSMDINFDRPLQVLSDRSSVLSNDLTLIDKAAEAINEKYDAQEKALQSISELNQEIASQEKSRISLADALSQGDISAAAQLANDIRSNAADTANRRSGDLISAARKAETDSLVSASGMTKAQIEAEQFKISQDSYALELLRKKAQEEILKLEDQVYNITELREAKLLDIRKIETLIDNIKTNQLAKAQENLDKLQAELEKNQEILDAKLLAIENEKLGWDSIQIKLDAYKLALTQSKDELVSMLDLVNQIAAAMAALSSANSASAFVSSGGNENSYVSPTSTAADVAALEEFIAIVEELDAAQVAADEAAAFAAQNTGSGPDAAYDRKLAAEAAARLAAAQAAYDATLPTGDVTGGGGGPSGRFAMMAMSSGGMVKPKYFSVGGSARGTDIIPAMLTPGEFVMSKYAVDSYGVDKMKSINRGSYEGEKVYNYNLNVNVKSDANPEDIARVVMTQIRQVDSQRIRTQRG